MRSREIHLVRRPAGAPVAGDFATVEREVAVPGAGEVLVRNRWMAVDPAMRGRMDDAKSYVPPFALDAPMEGPAIGEVVASNDPGFTPGDMVFSRLGWREAFVTPGEALRKRDCTVLPPQAYLGFAGMTGLTAYAGLFRVGQLKPGDVVFVSAASGGVGSLVCQMAKLKGHKVIGSAGGAAKAAFLRDRLKLDGVIDYKAEPNLTKALARETKAIGAIEAMTRRAAHGTGLGTNSTARSRSGSRAIRPSASVSSLASCRRTEPYATRTPSAPTTSSNAFGVPA